MKTNNWEEKFDKEVEYFTSYNLVFYDEDSCVKDYYSKDLKQFISNLLAEQEESFYIKAKQDEMIKKMLADQRKELIEKIEEKSFWLDGEDYEIKVIDLDKALDIIKKYE